MSLEEVWGDSPFGEPQEAEMGAVSNSPRKKASSQVKQSRRELVQMFHKSGMTQRKIAEKLNELGFEADQPLVSNDLAYIAKQSLESYNNADGSSILADMMQDYLSVRRSLYEVMVGAHKPADRVAASRTLLQLMNDFRSFLIMAKVINTEDGRSNPNSERVDKILEAMEKNPNNADLYSIFASQPVGDEK